ncbi:SDR family oxidoreductase [Kribbella sp. NPDC026596]|uniref:SDR family oxidoreductase n=1 Tax=Kribbella sp. NPDC026596 TaxID=3155122 RepID=UPI0033C8D83E
MNLTGKSVAITGAAGGLGSAIAREARRRGATELALLDVDETRLAEVADQVGGFPIACDLGDEQEAAAALAQMESKVGLVDVYAANAGVNFFSDLTTAAAEWDRAWRTHVLSSAWAFRKLAPAMAARASGHLVITASTAAISLSPKSVAYTVTKAAQLALAEGVGATFRSRGVLVTCFCPGGIRTPMLDRMSDDGSHSRRAHEEAHTPEAAAAILLDGIEAGRALVTTQTRTRDDLAQRGADYEAWMADVVDRFASDRTGWSG